MLSNEELTGRVFPPYDYKVARAQIRDYARAVGETNPLYLDIGAARDGGYRDLVAPPMFAVVYAGEAFSRAVHDPALGIDFAMLVHGGQEFEWGPLVIAGDRITTAFSLADVHQRVGMRFYDFHSLSRNERDEEVSRGVWTMIVRPREDE